MTLKYHYSDQVQEWRRCVSRELEGKKKCPYGKTAAEHKDRTGIAHEGGGVIAMEQDGKTKRGVVTPMIGPAYAVIADHSGAIRTYDEDGSLISSRERKAYGRRKLLPSLTARAKGGLVEKLQKWFGAEQSEDQAETEAPKDWKAYRVMIEDATDPDGDGAALFAWFTRLFKVRTP